MPLNTSLERLATAVQRLDKALATQALHKALAAVDQAALLSVELPQYEREQVAEALYRAADRLAAPGGGS